MNEGWGLLSVAMNTAITTVTVQTGQGARFPTLAAGSVNWFYITLIDSSGNEEICKVTATTGDTFTVLRAQDGTIALSFAASCRVELRMCAAIYNDYITYVNNLVAGAITAEAAARTAQLAAWEALFPYGMVALWAGNTTNIPAGWHLCDGTAGTPDLRDRFVVGAGLSYAVGAAGGVAVYALSGAQLPYHTHGVNDPTHAHAIADPGHIHGLGDPGHAHTPSQGGSIFADGPGNNISTALNGGGINTYLNGGTAPSATGIYMGAAGTGIGIYGNYTGISIQAAGASAAIENRPPFYAWCYIMKIV